MWRLLVYTYSNCIAVCSVLVVSLLIFDYFRTGVMWWMVKDGEEEGHVL